MCTRPCVSDVIPACAGMTSLATALRQFEMPYKNDFCVNLRSKKHSPLIINY